MTRVQRYDTCRWTFFSDEKTNFFKLIFFVLKKILFLQPETKNRIYKINNTELLK